MIEAFISNQITKEFPHQPTEQQREVIKLLGSFISTSHTKKAFLLKGYAGTGKTTLVSALVRALKNLQQKYLLLAPTGRAAKVLASYSGSLAFTIHKRIYRQKSIADFRFQLSDNLYKDTLFIVDEASMISNNSFDSTFGSGRLLEDLIEFVYSSQGCSLLFLGDAAQLPPVEQENSPALESKVLKSMGLNLLEYQLTQVVRQALDSGILSSATDIRTAIAQENTNRKPQIDLGNHTDIQRLNGLDFVEAIEKSYSSVGVEETIVVTRSNKRANMYNNGIRACVMMKEEELTNGDLLMVTRNNYFWNKEYPDIDFIANGDVLKITRIRRYYNIYNNNFVDLSLQSQDSGWEIDARIWLESLKAETPKQMSEMNQKLFDTISEDYPEITNRRQLIKEVLNNEFFNSLQVKFAYAVTCHKAQGGQWRDVFIDHGYLPENQLNRDYYRWLYTALTRASNQVFLVNFPDDWFI